MAQDILSLIYDDSAAEPTKLQRMCGELWELKETCLMDKPYFFNKNIFHAQDSTFFFLPNIKICAWEFQVSFESFIMHFHFQEHQYLEKLLILRMIPLERVISTLILHFFSSTSSQYFFFPLASVFFSLERALWFYAKTPCTCLAWLGFLHAHENEETCCTKPVTECNSPTPGLILKSIYAV